MLLRASSSAENLSFTGVLFRPDPGVPIFILWFSIQKKNKQEKDKFSDLELKQIKNAHPTNVINLHFFYCIILIVTCHWYKLLLRLYFWEGVTKNFWKLYNTSSLYKVHAEVFLLNRNRQFTYSFKVFSYTQLPTAPKSPSSVKILTYPVILHTS